MEKYTKDYVNKVLKEAEREMLKLNHPYVGSEHMILALLKNKEISNICDEYNLTYEIFKSELINIIGTSNIKTTTILHTPLLKSIINVLKIFSISEYFSSFSSNFNIKAFAFSTGYSLEIENSTSSLNEINCSFNFL